MFNPYNNLSDNLFEICSIHFDTPEVVQYVLQYLDEDDRVLALYNYIVEDYNDGMYNEDENIILNDAADYIKQHC